MDDGRKGLISHVSAPRRHPTWRTIVIGNTIFTGLTLIVYLAFLKRIFSNFHISHGLAEVFSGSCSQASRITAHAHFAASAFAVLLFAAGIHAVQLLLSPTRAEVDQAHARDRWLHIGVGGLRNIRWIQKRRLIPATVLAATAIILPFLHFSMVFTTFATTDRKVSLVTEGYLKGSRLDGSTEQFILQAKAQQYHNISKSAHAGLRDTRYDVLLQQMRGSLTDLIHLSPEECRATYSSLQIPMDFSNVLLISSSNVSNTLDGYIDGDLQYPEMTSGPKYWGMQVIDWFKTNGTVPISRKQCIATDFDFGDGTSWNVPVWDYYCTIVSYRVEYCLAQKFEPNCGVGLHTRILIGTVVCVFVEFVCLAILALSHGFRPLATTGDAVASFLRHPDTLGTKSVDLAMPAVHSPTSRFDKFGARRSDKDIATWKRKWPVWRAAVDTKICALLIDCLYLSFFAVAIAVLVVYHNDRLSSYQPLTLQSPAFRRKLFAILPSLGSIHLAISVTYPIYNHLWSRMLAASELNAFSKTQAPLRVTLPIQDAHTTHYLNIKPQFSAVLIVALFLLHYLTARALNIISIRTYNVMGNYSHQRITYGISIPSGILALVIGFVMLCVLALALRRKLHGGMPVLGTCSMAISAACHADDAVTNLKHVRYGRNPRTGKIGFLSRESQED